MLAAVAGFFALAGAMVTGAVTLLVQWYLRHNGIKDKWLDRRQQLHSVFLKAVNDFFSTLWDYNCSFSAHDKNSSSANSIVENLNKKASSLNSALFELQLVAGSESSELAKDLVSELLYTHRFLDQYNHQENKKYLEQAAVSAQKAMSIRQIYFAAYRKELGFSSPPLTERIEQCLTQAEQLVTEFKKLRDRWKSGPYTGGHYGGPYAERHDGQDIEPYTGGQYRGRYTGGHYGGPYAERHDGQDIEPYTGGQYRGPYTE